MRVLLVDLNNFARYPSIAVGYLVAILRASGIDVEVMAPLSTGATGVVRESRPPVWGALEQRLRYDTAMSRNPVVAGVRRRLARCQLPRLARDDSRFTEAFADRLAAGSFDAVLVSTYLMYYDLCADLGRTCARSDIPFVVGGPYFSQPEVAREWLGLPGLSALVGGEVEPHLAELVRSVAGGRSAAQHPGVWAGANGDARLHAPPLQNLDSLPAPDYSDFPWELYPSRIIPAITGRGCAWGRCAFCSDITSTAGRTFRTRSPAHVLDEIALQSSRYGTRDFVFTDLKLNSSLDVWAALLGEFQERAPGGRWIGSVHIPAQGDGGLSRGELEAAKAAGMVRLTTGLESGSQRVLSAMRKGTRLEETARVIRDAGEAGISVRTTMIIGYPGETAEDVEATTAFLRSLDGHIERIVLNRLQIVTGAGMHRRMEEAPERLPGVTPLTVNHRMASVPHHYAESERRPYRRAVHKLIDLVHEVNRRPLRRGAEAFEGVM